MLFKGNCTKKVIYLGSVGSAGSTGSAVPRSSLLQISLTQQFCASNVCFLKIKTSVST